MRPATLRRVSAWLVRVVLVVVGAWALYVVTMNVFIRSHLFRDLIRSSTDVKTWSCRAGIKGGGAQAPS